MLKAACRALGAGLLVQLTACTSLQPDTNERSVPDRGEVSTASPGEAGRWAQEDGVQWQHIAFPGKQVTQFRAVRIDGRTAMAATAVSSASMLRKKVQIAPADLGKLAFSWKVRELIATADMAQRDKDDSPVRVVLAFEGDRRKWSARDAMLSELARALMGEEMPYATLMYVWCNRRAPGSVIVNPRTGRVRKMVVESGPARLGQWLAYERDVRADFRAAFGEEPGPLVAVGIMSDADNTQSTAQAWFGPVRMLRAD